MKEIKFRGRCIKSDEWVYGFYAGDHPFLNQSTIISGVTEYDVQTKTVGQFTGLKDKTGKEIYEGDLLVDRYWIDDDDLSKGYNESLLPVVWCDKKLMWCVDASFKKDESYLTSLVEYFGDNLEVGGNVYEL